MAEPRLGTMPHAMPFQRGLLVASAYFHIRPMAVTHSTTDDTLQRTAECPRQRRADTVQQDVRSVWNEAAVPAAMRSARRSLCPNNEHA